MKPIWQHTSDEEYVERVRARMKTAFRCRWVWPVFLVAGIALVIILAHQFQQFERLFGVDKAGLLNGLFFGACVGITLGMVAIQAGTSLMRWWDARHGFRTERLMLKYHDELREAKTSNPILESSSDRADAV